MKKTFLILLALAMGEFVFADATINGVTVRQDWPWSKDLVVQVEVSGASESGVDLAVHAYDGETDLGEIVSGAAITSGSLFAAKNGTTFFTIDPFTAFPNADTSAFGAFRLEVSVAGEGDPLVDRVEYRIVDLEAPYTVTDLKRRDFYERPELYGAFTKDYSTVGPGFVSSLAANETFVWTGVNSNDIYKTTKLVLKRIPAKGVLWHMGPSEDDTSAKSAGSWSYPNLGESRFAATFSSDYYLGVFELTQEQYFRLTGEKPSYYTNLTYWATRPVENTAVRPQDMPTTLASVHDFGFRVPTEAQWEFAARAGNDSANLPNGKERSAANYAELEGYSAGRGHTSQNDGVGAGGTYLAGTGRPNAFGLFNTLGNVVEWTDDLPRKDLATYYGNPTEANPKSDPKATKHDLADGYHVYKGGGFNGGLMYRPTARFADTDRKAKNAAGVYVYGIRLMMPEN